MLRFAWLFLPCLSAFAELRVVTIGDSLTDEYAGLSRIEFSATATNPSVALAKNWLELLDEFRPADVNFGLYQTHGDLRLTGYARNFGIIGTTTFEWLTIVTTDSPGDLFTENAPYYLTRAALVTQLATADVVVIFLGGNDLKNDYNDLFNEAVPGALYTQIRNRLNALHQYVRSYRPTVPIVVATVPDVGATTQIYNIYNIPSKQASTRERIAAMNEAIALQFGVTYPNAGQPTTVARIDNLTDRILDIVLNVDPSPFDLNGTEFIIPGNPQISPDRLFCRDNFHPNTVAQAVIANEIIAAINHLLPGSIPPFTNRYILDDILGFDPDQPYLDWIDGYPVTASGPDDDDDGDGLPNLVEMTLGTPPHTFSAGLLGNWKTGVQWTPNPVATRYASLVAEESSSLDGWSVVPAIRLSEDSGVMTATPPSGSPKHFVRLRATARP